MKTNRLDWSTSLQPNSTHMVDDGGMVYFCHTPGMTLFDVADRFRIDYDGNLDSFDVTNIETGENSEF